MNSLILVLKKTIPLTRMATAMVRQGDHALLIEINKMLKKYERTECRGDINE